MNRRDSLLALGMLGLSSAALRNLAQAQAQLPRIGVISPAGEDQFSESSRTWQAFLQGLRESGWISGKNVAIEVRFAGFNPEPRQAAVAELVKMKVDVLYASGVLEVSAARRATDVIPIVGTDLVSDPVALGFAASLARPGGNVTGVYLDVPELVAKHLELLREAVPGLKRVGALGHPDINAAQFRATAEAAQRVRTEFRPLEFRTDADLDAAFATAARAGTQALLLFASPLMYVAAQRVGALAAKHRVPAVSNFAELAHAGALMSFGPSLAEMWRRSGAMIGRILKDGKPATLPIERPHQFEFVVNAKAAKALGLKLPQSILVRADRVIE